MARFGRWLIPIIVGIIIWFFVLPMAGVSNFLLNLALTIGLVGVIGLVFKAAKIPIPFLAKPWVSIALILIAVVFGGAFGLTEGFKFGATVAPPGTIAPVPGDCLSSVSPEIRGSAASLVINAYDKEADVSTNVDLGTNCWLYKNSVSASGFQGTTTDTTNPPPLTGMFSVGDVIHIRCGGTSYYTDPKEVCINAANMGITLDSYAMVSTSNLQITGYDSSGATTLTAGAPNVNDYNITMGAGETTTFYLKLKNNVANRAFQFMGWGIATFYNISSCRPVSGYTAQAIPSFMKNVDVQMNAAGTVVITKDYTPWVRSAPLLLREWEEVKDQFELRSDPVRDPNGGAGTTAFDGVAIVAFDATYALDVHNVASFGYHTPTPAQANVGLAETWTSPLGRDNGVLISVE